MFVGTTGVQRAVQKTAELMKEHGTDDIWEHGGIPLSVIQKYLNLHYSLSLDLFGSEVSSNAASYFTAGLKGRWMETRRKDDHVLTDLTMDVPVIEDGVMTTRTVPMLTALNLDLRNEYAADCENGVRRWNQELEEAGLEQRLYLPHQGFNRKVGAFAGHHVSPTGEILDVTANQTLATIPSLPLCFDWLPDNRMVIVDSLTPDPFVARLAFVRSLRHTEG